MLKNLHASNELESEHFGFFVPLCSSFQCYIWDVVNIEIDSIIQEAAIYPRAATPI